MAPVGLAWAQALQREPGLELWAGDGKHPSKLGSYLTACVFYASLTGRDASASRFTAGLEPRLAQLAQAVADEVVNGRGRAS